MRAKEFQEGTRCWKGYKRKGFKTMFGKRVPNCVKREDRYLVVDKFNDPVKLFDNEDEAVSYFHANYEDLNTEASYKDLSQDQLNQIEQWYKKWSRVEGGDGGSLPDDWFSTADHGDLSDGVAKADKDAGLDYTEDDLPVTDKFLEFSKSKGNDLTTANSYYKFEGLKEGDKWCLCVSRWIEAYEAGCPPNLIFEATNIKTLDYVSFDKLLEFKA